MANDRLTGVRSYLKGARHTATGHARFYRLSFPFRPIRIRVCIIEYWSNYSLGRLVDGYHGQSTTPRVIIIIIRKTL